MRQRTFLRGFLVTCALVAAASAGLTTAALATGSKGCKSTTVAGKHACVKAGDTCVARNRAAYKKVGLACVAGRLRRAAAPPATTTQPTTTTAPTTTTIGDDFPLAGHYQGTTSQGRPLSFDVRDDRKNLTNVVGAFVDETCNPSRNFTFEGFETGGFDYPVSSVGSWHLDGGNRATNGDVSSSTKITMSAHFSAGGRAVGTYDVTSSVTEASTSYSCSGSVTWTASHS